MLDRNEVKPSKRSALVNALSPRHIAVVGASPRPGSLGQIVLTQLTAGGFDGAIHKINPKHALNSQDYVARLIDLPEVPDLVVVASPPASIPAIITDAVTIGAPAVVILTAGLGHGQGSLAEAALNAARGSGTRLIGPNCLGLVAPWARLNAGFAARLPMPGGIALISQSGAIASAMIEWACAEKIGLSALVSLGDMIDVGIEDCLEHFASDDRASVVLLYIESLRDGPRFMKAASAAARKKPVVVMKGGRRKSGAQAAATHTGALAGSHAVYEAAFRQSGLVQVDDLESLFATAEVLGRCPPFVGDKLAIITNGGGLGVLSVDRLEDLYGTPATLSRETMALLDAALPGTWSRSNPIDVIGDAPPERYAAAVQAAYRDPDVDALLVMHCPTAVTAPVSSARAVVQAARNARAADVKPKPVLAAWIGNQTDSDELFSEAGIASFRTGTDAVAGFVTAAQFWRRQNDMSGNQPCPAPEVDRSAALKILEEAGRNERTWLDIKDVSELLSAYGLPFVESSFAASIADVDIAARRILGSSAACALKIQSPDIVHKSDIGGVRLGLATVEDVSRAAETMKAAIARAMPEARVDGFLLQPMIDRAGRLELIAGTSRDPVFGPVLLFGAGGVAVEVINDKALALAPVSAVGARDLLARTRIAALLKGYRNVPPFAVNALVDLLQRLSQLAADCPQVLSIDLNPVLIGPEDVIIPDARVALSAPAVGGTVS